MFCRLGDTLLAAGYRTDFPGEAHFAEDHQILRKRSVSQAGDHRQQQRQVCAGLRDFDATDHVNEDVLIRHLQPAVTVQEQAIDPNPNAEVGAPYKAKTSADQRYTRPLAETPQTIQVVTGEAIRDSGQTDLKSILATQPGITLGTGENGG